MIRRARPDDLLSLMNIYNEAILNTTATFDTVPKDLSNRREWFDAHFGKYIINVYEENSYVCGYASLSQYRERRAFDNTVEISVYIHPDFRNKHIGTKLYHSVINYAKNSPDISNIISLITSENTASIKLHKSLGFSYCGTIKNAGRKFERDLDLSIYQLLVK